AVAISDNIAGISSCTRQFHSALISGVSPIAINEQSGYDQLPIKETRLDHVPRFLPGIYSVTPADSVTSKAPSPTPNTKRQAIRKSIFGEKAPTTIEAI